VAKQPKTAITPTREQDYPEWYQQVVRAAELAESSPVRGCMVIKPWGYALWENLQRSLDDRLKATGHQNAYFPLFIPLSFLEKEAEHVEGFAAECAVVTHHRLTAKPGGGLQPSAPLEEPLIVRPTSETIIGEMFAKWIQSYRDLPLLINQWANVVRWELRPRLFLRTTEFLWQEGHTAHATEAEAREETAMILDLYADFVEGQLAIPVLKGVKSDAERFPGAVATWCIEALMQDRKALQAGTSHFLGQNFAKAADITFQDDAGKLDHAWTTSWGVSTRLIGGMVMTHGDDDGMIMPPRVAPLQVVILPITRDDETRSAVLDHCRELGEQLRDVTVDGRPLRVQVDQRDLRGGEKTWSWIKKGVPIRVEVGPRDMEAGTVSVRRRDQGPKERTDQPQAEFVGTVASQLEAIQQALLDRARAYQEQHTYQIDSRDEFYDFFTPPQGRASAIHGGFALCHWSGEAEVEAQIKSDLNVTVRCIPTDPDPEEGRCIISGKPSPQRVVFAKAY